MKAVSNALLQAITQRLVARFQPEQVILFGSHAWGQPHEDSDIDLMVLVSNSNISEYQRAVEAHRCLIDLNVPKDVIVKTKAEFDFYSQVPASLEH